MKLRWNGKNDEIRNLMKINYLLNSFNYFFKVNHYISVGLFGPQGLSVFIVMRLAQHNIYILFLCRCAANNEIGFVDVPLSVCSQPCNSRNLLLSIVWRCEIIQYDYCATEDSK